MKEYIWECLRQADRLATENILKALDGNPVSKQTLDDIVQDEKRVRQNYIKYKDGRSN